MTTPSAASVVPNATELLEQILLFAQIADVLQCSAASPTFEHITEGSIALRKHLFLDKAEEDLPVWWVGNANTEHTSARINITQLSLLVPFDFLIRQRVIYNPMLFEQHGDLHDVENDPLGRNMLRTIHLRLTPAARHVLTNVDELSLITGTCRNMFTSKPVATGTTLHLSRSDSIYFSRHAIHNSNGVRFEDIMQEVYSINGALDPSTEFGIWAEGIVFVSKEEKGIVKWCEGEL